MKVLVAEFYTVAVPALVILFGALVHATAQLKVAREKQEAFTITDFIIQFVIAAFSGMIAGMTSALFFDSELMIALCAGIGAFLGMAGVNAIANAFLQMLVSRIDKGGKTR